MLRVTRSSIALSLVAVAIMAGRTHAQEKPNILVIWGDDVGWNNPSMYNRGMMGYQHAQHRPHCQRGSRCLPTGTVNKAARQADPRSSRAKADFAPGC